MRSALIVVALCVKLPALDVAFFSPWGVHVGQSPLTGVGLHTYHLSLYLAQTHRVRDPLILCGTGVVGVLQLRMFCCFGRRRRVIINVHSLFRAELLKVGHYVVEGCACGETALGARGGDNVLHMRGRVAGFCGDTYSTVCLFYAKNMNTGVHSGLIFFCFDNVYGILRTCSVCDFP